ncbi:MAG: exonuclease SbcCD subunit D [Crenarchaeota archaeon]|nr:exonuclease SbcCD subunit D [Thermoproteota archaeon]
MKILHTADFHLGARIINFLPPSANEKRREDFYKNMFSIAEYAIKNKIDIVLISGDIFNRPDPASRDFVEFSKFVGELTGAGIKVVVIAGNHDVPKTSGARSTIESLTEAKLPNFYYFKLIPKEPLVIDANGREKVGIVPIPYINPRYAQEVGEEYSSLIGHYIRDLVERPIMKNVDYKILMAHLTISEAKFTKIPIVYSDPNEPKVKREDLHEKHFDYIALGHVHQPQEIGEKIYYAGSIERIDFSEEGEQKSFYVINLEKGNFSVEKVDLYCRPMKKERLEYDGSSKDEFLRILRGLSLTQGALVKLIVSASETTFRNVISRSLSDVQRILLNEKKILGYIIKEEKKQAAHPTYIPAEISDLRRKILEYIDKLPEPPEVKERAKEIAKTIMDEVGL